MEEIFAQSARPEYALDGLTELSDAAAKSLDKHKGEINGEGSAIHVWGDGS